MTKTGFVLFAIILVSSGVFAVERGSSQGLPPGLYSLEQVECSMDGRTFHYRQAPLARQEKTTFRVYPLDSLKGNIEYQSSYVAARTSEDCQVHFLLKYRLKNGGIEISAHAEQGKVAALQNPRQRDGLGCRAFDGIKTEFWTLQEVKSGMWSWVGEDLSGQCVAPGVSQSASQGLSRFSSPRPRPAKIRYLMIRQSLPEVL